jgi:hypothetical protein
MGERFVTRGFVGRRRETAPGGRLPPGQHEVGDFPVLSAGPTPRTPLEKWTFSLEGEVETPVRWSWEEFQVLPAQEFTVDIHCVTKWTKLDTRWRGVSVDTLLEHVQLDPRAGFVMAGSGQRAGVRRLRIRRPAAGAGTWRPGQAGSPPFVLLEKRQVGAWVAADGAGQARILGIGRVPPSRGPMEGRAVRG